MKTTALLFLLAASALLQAQDSPTITIRKGDTTSIAVKGVGGADGASASKILQNDLQVSGWFSLGAPERASYLISGTAGGGSLQGQVTDPQGATVLQKTYSGDARNAAHQFADDIIETLTGNKGIARSKIAFVASRTGRKEIYTADYDGANVKQLTNDGSISVAPALSPDGKKLAYTGYLSGYADIYLIDLVSGARNRIIKFPGTNSGAAFAPDGNRIACTMSKDGNPELYIVGANGSGARRLTKTRGVESSATWSPTGSEIIYSSDERGGPQLYRIGAGGGSGTLIPTGYNYCTEPSWSPDNKKVASTVRQSGGFSIAITDLQSGATRIVATPGEDPVWGPDSRHLIYSNGSAIMLLDASNGKSVSLVSGLGKISEPTWSR